MDGKAKGITSGGVLLALTVAFIFLKIAGVIKWSWALVLAPIWVPFAFVGVFFLIAVLVVIYRDI